MIYRSAPYLATLNDPYRRLQGHTIRSGFRIFFVCERHWHGVWGREVLQRSSGAEPRWGSGSEAPRSPKNVTSWGWKNTYGEKQELSYREQIASQLRTQFVQGISVTLKSTLRVTQGHWKRNHLTDHIHDLQYDELFTLWRNVTSGNRPKHGPKASA